MSEGPQASDKPKGGRLLPLTLGALALVGVAGAVYIIAQSSTKPPPAVATGPLPPTPLADKVSRPEAPTPAPDYAFRDATGKEIRIADLKGKVVVLNAWATWCGPCKTEMPTLAKLAKAYEGKPVEVVAVSIDTPEKAQAAALFIAQNSPLKFYHDPAMKILFRINGQGAPTTVIYGKDGLEKSRVSGEADWTSKEAHALVDEALAAGG